MTLSPLAVTLLPSSNVEILLNSFDDAQKRNVYRTNRPLEIEKLKIEEHTANTLCAHSHSTNQDDDMQSIFFGENWWK